MSLVPFKPTLICSDGLIKVLQRAGGGSVTVDGCKGCCGHHTRWPLNLLMAWLLTSSLTDWAELLSDSAYVGLWRPSSFCHCSVIEEEFKYAFTFIPHWCGSKPLNTSLWPLDDLWTSSGPDTIHASVQPAGQSHLSLKSHLEDHAVVCRCSGCIFESGHLKPLHQLLWQDQGVS